jgi:hypothetical protein
MATILDKILGKKPKAAEEIRAEQTRAEQALEQAQADLRAAGQRYTATLLDPDPGATRSAKTALSEAEDAVARAQALVAALREKFLEACEAEAEAEKLSRYEEAERAADAARNALLDEYQEAALRVVEILQKINTAETLIEKVNADLPAGAARLASVEMPIRGHLAMPREAVKRERFHQWVDAVGNVISDPQHIRETEKGVGIYQREGRLACRVWRKTFERTTWRDSAQPLLPERLGAAVRLPGLYHGDQAIWKDGMAGVVGKPKGPHPFGQNRAERDEVRPVTDEKAEG